MRKKDQGQSLLEFAILVPLFVLFLLGAAEITLFIGAYINVIDLTREAARFASVRDPTKPGSDNFCGAAHTNSFFYDTACIFSPLAGSDSCSTADPSFCDGFNSTLFFKSAEDDIVITSFTVTGNVVTSSSGGWAWSDHDSDTVHNSNWQKNCDGTSIVPTLTAYFDKPKIDTYLAQTTDTVPNKGFVTVEAYYCYHQVLKVPLVGLLFPDPMRIHVYTVMPLPAAAPLPTQYPTDTPTPGP